MITPRVVLLGAVVSAVLLGAGGYAGRMQAGRWHERQVCFDVGKQADGMATPPAPAIFKPLDPNVGSYPK